MRKFCPLCILVIALVFGNDLAAQDFSNKGKEFWVAYGYHQAMNSTTGGSQDMKLYFAAEQNTNVRVEIPGVGYVQTYFVAANSVTESATIPKIGAQDAKLMTTSNAPEKKGIHITADKPIVAYAHIYNQNVSGATILFPVNTLGREYYSINYTNNSNIGNSNCWFYVVAADTGTTTIEVVPSANIVSSNNSTVKYPAGQPVTVSLTQGQVFNFMGQVSGLSGVDLTGSTIRSISTGSGGCKRIAVFSGSGRINISCTRPFNQGASSDNYMCQAFPKSAWGKRYLTVPAAVDNSFNIYRICVSDPATVVRINGAITTLPLSGNFYYEVPATDKFQLIEADKPIMVAQYFTSQNECGNVGGANSIGDPEVIYLSPVEQNISKVLWNATPHFAIQQHYINVVIPNAGTALTSFRIDGTAISPGLFTTHPQDSRYSYLIRNVSAGQHIIESDSGFNAVAYGFGTTESYGYNAGTNIKDQYRYISVDNQYAVVDRVPAACIGAPFGLSMTFPYQPTQLIWAFNGLFPNDTIRNPVATSSSVVNGVTLYKYTLNGTHVISTAGTYPIKIIAENPTADGCNGIQEIDYELEIYNQPTADFNFTGNGCVSDPVQFNEAGLNTFGRSVLRRSWVFGDNSAVATGNPVAHTYAAPGPYEVKYSVITDIGCKSDTARHTVTLAAPPTAAFSAFGPVCQGKPVTFKDNSTVATDAISKWTWDFGDGSPVVVATTGADQLHTYSGAGPYTVLLKVETASGCASPVTTGTVTLHPNPVVAFNLPNVCLPAGAAQLSSSSTIADGTESQFTYDWNFGDGSPNATVPNPLHNYAGVGPFNIVLTVTSNNGCSSSLTQPLTTVFAEPKAVIQGPAETCLGAAASFTDQSLAPGSTVTDWHWDFGDGTTATVQNPNRNYASTGTYTVTLSVKSAVGCQSVSTANIATHSVVINPLPTSNFRVSVPGCVGQEVTFTSTSVPNAGNIVKWNWNFGDNTNTVTTTPAPLVHSYPNVAVYQPTLQVETDKGCVSVVVPLSVAVNPVPAAGFSFAEICVSDALAPFTDTSRVAGGMVNAWEWNFGDANASATNPNVSTLQNPTHHFTVPGTYSVHLISTSDAGCKDTVVSNVEVNGSILNPQVSLVNTEPLCSNKTISIKDGSTINAGNIEKVVIYWDYPDLNNKTVDEDPTPGKIYTHDYTQFGSPATKAFTINYEIWSGITCVNRTQFPVNLLATPQLAFGAVLPVCDNSLSFQLNSVRLVNTLPGSGSFAGSGVSVSGLFDPSVAGAGSHPITYTYTADNTCSNSIVQTLVVNPAPDANAGPDRYLLEGGYIRLAPVLVTNMPVTYTWSPAQYLDDAGVASPKASPPVEFQYKLTVRSDEGCIDEDSLIVKILKNLVIPNIFSPNGDGVNDRWVIEHLESYPGCVIQIYNRYGQLVQRFVNYQPWDGRINGQDAPIGTYYYIIDPKNGRKPTTGFVDIIR